ncbi:amino acid deaminase [Comamonas flocculans]|uniref:Amino acid deaminase n=1 Tax=Comamonas flocculans TaxID=2597701 RepID=A0A5B8RV98_9BURK|nr:amino acid deaminase [Comamonas flocculans]QEA13441.1 amino acid deaminase [Comamonas flocculans]
MAADFRLDASLKGYPPAAAPCLASEIGGQGWNVLAGDLPLPLAVLRRGALAHNLAWMQRYASARGVVLAPHGKTTMSPELCAMQLAAGAWGLSFANVWQAQLGVAAGAVRIVIANQVLQDADLDALDALLASHAGLRVYFLVDSLRQLALIEDWERRHASARVFDVLLELGVPGQRTGYRTHEQALALARAAAASTAVRLCGIECYEGLLATGDSAHDALAVTELVRRALALARAVDAEDLWAAGEAQILLSAGGSAVFDLVLPLLRAQGLSRPVTGVLRSGCYLTHDHGNYQRFVHLVAEREGLRDSLQPALTVWALVQSVPEPGLALLNAGRRDLSFDIDLPKPVRWAAAATRVARPAPEGWKISALNDQHAYLRFPAGAAAPAVGDRVELGISHPCTTFDKWRWMALVEDDGAVSGAIHTCF